MGVSAMVTGGLTFMIGSGVTFLGLTVAEKMGVKINKTALRWTVRILVGGFVVWAVLSSGLIHHTLYGY